MKPSNSSMKNDSVTTMGSAAEAQFVSEPIEPLAGSFDTAAMSRGEPGLPTGFTWRGQEYLIRKVVDRWKESGPCRSSSSERYLRKHWYRIQTASGDFMRVYFQRQPRSRNHKQRWYLYDILPMADHPTE